jgi:beta-galactosidase
MYASWPVDPIHIEPNGVFVAPTVTDPGNGVHGDATTVVQTDIANTSAASAHLIVASELLDAEGRVIATASSAHEVSVSGSQKVRHEIALPGASLWSPQNPYLYRLRSTVAAGDKTSTRWSRASACATTPARPN